MNYIERFLREYTRPCPGNRIPFSRLYKEFKSNYNAEGTSRLFFLNTIIKAGVQVVPGRDNKHYIVVGVAIAKE